MRGGKSFKKGKKKDQDEEDEDTVVYIDIQSDQFVGRLIRLLGDLNTQVYCQDGKLRVCKICRAQKKKTRFKIGDVVLLSLRDCEVSNGDLEKGIRGSRGDIIGKFHPAQYPQLVASGINHSVFSQMVTLDGIVAALDAGQTVDLNKIKKEEDLFVDGKEESSDDSDDSLDIEDI